MKRRLVSILIGIAIACALKVVHTRAADTRTVFAALVMAEAGNQSITGKRLVADTVLNRVADPRFPDTIDGVIYQQSQYSVVWNGALQEYIDGRKEISEDCYQVVAEELQDQVDYDVIYFCAGGWSAYGEHAYKFEDHYFSR